MDATATRTDPSELTGAVTNLLDGLDPTDLSGSDRSRWLRSLTEADAMLTAARSRILAAGPGGPTIRSADLVENTGMSGAEARRAVRLADALAAVPAAADALTVGRITTGHASVLANGVSWLNQPAAALDDSLLEAAGRQSVDEFRATIAEWERIENGDTDGRQQAARQHRNRTFSWSIRHDGMVSLRGELAPDTGAMVTGALQALSEHLWRTEDERAPGPITGRAADSDRGRTTGQRNADAVVELARRATSPGGTADGSGGRPRVDLLVAVDLDRLSRETTGSRCHTADGVALPAATVRRLACDAGVIPVVLGSNGDVLDVGRRTRTIPTAIRNALVVRDGGCTHPGCDRPVSWCDAHHVVHWSDGGPTSLENLVLLCSAHHHQHHLRSGSDDPARFSPRRE